jgi:uncharacterized protein YecE (DUF72 family)
MRAMNSFRVACAGFRGPRGRYWRQGLDALELEPEAVRARPATLKSWRAGAPEYAAFLPVVDPDVAAARFEGEAADAGWRRTLAAAEGLQADTLLLHTRADFRPTRENRERLAAFLAAHPAPGLTVAWRAEGLWESQPEERDALCERLGILPVVDPLALEREETPLPAGARVFWRLLGSAGLGVRFSDYDLDHLLELCGEREGGYVVFGAPQMLRDARRLRSLLALQIGEAEEEAGDEEDLEDEEGFDEDDFDEDE